VKKKDCKTGNCGKREDMDRFWERMKRKLVTNQIDRAERREMVRQLSVEGAEICTTRN
jgi:hypothetical protein